MRVRLASSVWAIGLVTACSGEVSGTLDAAPSLDAGTSIDGARVLDAAPLDGPSILDATARDDAGDATTLDATTPMDAGPPDAGMRDVCASSSPVLGCERYEGAAASAGFLWSPPSSVVRAGDAYEGAAFYRTADQALTVFRPAAGTSAATSGMSVRAMVRVRLGPGSGGSGQWMLRVGASTRMFIHLATLSAASGGVAIAALAQDEADVRAGSGRGMLELERWHCVALEVQPDGRTAVRVDGAVVSTTGPGLALPADALFTAEAGAVVVGGGPLPYVVDLDAVLVGSGELGCP